MRLINADELVRFADECQRRYGARKYITWSQLKYLAEKIPAIDPDVLLGAWIPVEKMLPKSSGRFMVTIKNRGKYRTEMRNFDAATQKWESDRWIPDNIIAWRQRPAPYRPTKEGE